MDEQSIFLEALEKSTPEEVAAWLDTSCGGDLQLRERVEALLRQHCGANSFLERPACELEATCLAAPEAAILSGHASVLQSIGQRYGEIKRVDLRDADGEMEDPVVRPSSRQIPKSDVNSRYQFRGEIARGGMGAIIKGHDTDLGRDLAVKVLLDEHKDKPEVVQRFVEEAQIGGQLQHPGIAPVYELGQFGDQRPFFTMKLVKGKTLAALLAQRESPEQDQARLLGIFEQVCQTMAYAHSRNVIHRDLKPANIMVGAFGEVQVMDWGLAKVLQAGGIADETKAAKPKDVSVIETIRSGGSNTFDDAPAVGSQTRAGSVMGTPAYMPPEQALGETDRLDERADVFGLGAILCEILTGSPPYVAGDGQEILRLAVRGDLAECQSQLRASEAHSELIELALKCLDAAPAKRLKNAGVVADLVTKHIESVARKLKQAEVRRKLTYVVAASLLLLVMGLGAGGIWLQAQETKLQTQQAEAANQVAVAEGKRAREQEESNEVLQQVLYASKMQLASANLASGNVSEVAAILDSYVPQSGTVDRRGFEWYYLNQFVLRPSKIRHVDWQKNRLSREQLSRDWKRLLQSSVIEENDDEIRYRLLVKNPDSQAEVWSAEVTRPASPNDVTNVAAMSQDGSKVSFYSHDETASHVDMLSVDIWNIDTKEHHVVKLKDIELIKSLFGELVYVSATLSPNGRYFALEHRSPNQPNKVRLVVWAIGDAEPLHSTDMDQPLHRQSRWRFSPDGSRMMTVISPTIGMLMDNQSDPRGDDSRLLVLETKTGQEMFSSPIEPGYISMPGGFSPDGNLIAATGLTRPTSDYPIQAQLWIWDAETGKRIRTISPKSNQPGSLVQFSPDSRFVCITRSGELFDVRSGAPLGKLTRLQQFSSRFITNHVKFTADGRSIVAAMVGGDVLKWQIPSQHVDSNDFTEGGGVFVSADGTHAGRVQLADPGEESWVYVYGVDGSRRVMNIPHQLFRNVRFHALSSDCRFVAFSTKVPRNAEDDSETADRRRGYEVTLWEVESGKQMGTLWSRWEHEPVVEVYSVPKRGLFAGVARTRRGDGEPTCRLLVWDVATLTTEASIDIVDYSAIVFSPDGKAVAIERPGSAGNENATNLLTIYGVDDGAEISQFNVHPTPPQTGFDTKDVLVFNSDGSSIAALNAEGNCIDIWDLPSGKKRLALQGASNRSTFTWSATDDRLIAFDSKGAGQGQLMVWDTETGVRLLAHDDHGRVQSSLKRLPSGNQIIAWPRFGPPRIWDGTPDNE